MQALSWQKSCFFKPEVDGREAKIKSLPNVNFGREFLPRLRNETVASHSTDFEMPQPDHAIGYIPYSHTKLLSPPLEIALILEEEDKALGCVLLHSTMTQVLYI
jgi:hypothetical protein